MPRASRWWRTVPIPPGNGRSATRSTLPALALRADAEGYLDRGALEAELLTQPALEEPSVAGLDEAGREDHEPRRPGRGLRREQDARLLAAAHRVRVGGDDLAEERVEPARRHAVVPRLQGPLQRRDELLDRTPGLGRDVDARRPRHLDQLALDLALEVVPTLLVEQVPLVVGHHECPTGVDDVLHDADVLLGDGL